MAIHRGRAQAGLVAALLVAACSEQPATQYQEPAIGRYEYDLLAARVETLEKAQPVPKDMDLKLGDDGFTIVPSDYGALTVQLISVQPEGSGSRATLKFGNPLNTSITDARLFAGWGKVSPKGEAQKVDGYKHFTIPGDIPAGSWINKTIVIDGVKPSDLGYIRALSVSGGTIGLTVR
ncbi:MAG: DUF3251 domain-containing protein [Alphaproteobacteria bacterium]|nr:DUF3251 domain-containing protein [Alphaproteobacteria bacterium]MBU0795064.1 DUF3251 domain-containing protein [Alphaproteobacteria bacterium]MBU0875579.1 DUF3251 domain-containing protein [Alphaproteobacteria bacterium]MBU1770797.1 DUF3251 domain-containing protein [Alphaproteobacteria bacterium]